MNGKGLTLIAILAFVALVIGTFVWFVGSWTSTGNAPDSGALSASTEERRA